MKINGTDSMSRRLHKPFVALFLITACVITLANAQETNNSKPAQPAALVPMVINIWPGVAPGSEQWKQKEATLHMGPMESIVNVTTPTLTAYLPDPAKATGTAVMLAPGSGFLFLGTDTHEVAEWLAARGIAGFVLKYRRAQIEGETEAQLSRAGGARFGAQIRNYALIAEDRKYALDDTVQPIKVGREHAVEWGISSDRVVFMGFSAGGMITEYTAIQPEIGARPNYAAQFTAPTFLPCLRYRKMCRPSLWRWRKTTISPVPKLSCSTTHSRQPDTSRNFTSMNTAAMAGACASRAQRAIIGSKSSTGGWKRTG